MTSSKKTEANKANSRRSTGPRTDSGKARASMNALKHGLTAARTIVVGDESEADLESQRAGFAAAKAPFGAIEAFLVNRLTHLAWKMGRGDRLEAELLEWGIHAEEADRVETNTEATFGFPTELMVDASTSADEGNGVPHRRQGRRQAMAKLRLAAAFVRLSSGEDLLGRVLRYQGESERAFFKTLSALDRIQRQRLGDSLEASLAAGGNVENGRARDRDRGHLGRQLAVNEGHETESKGDPHLQPSDDAEADRSADVADLDQVAGAQANEPDQTADPNPETKPTAWAEGGGAPLMSMPSNPGPGTAAPAAAARPGPSPPQTTRYPETNPVIDARVARMERARIR